MRFIRHKKIEGGADSFIFRLTRRDHQLLLSVLQLFPVTNVATHRLSRNSPNMNKANQELLIEAMEEQRRGHAKKIESFVRHHAQFIHEVDRAVQLILTGEQIEWLLQALNDIRVGSWMRLGCPEMEEARRTVHNQEKASHFAAMELSGYFQSALLSAFRTEAI